MNLYEIQKEYLHILQLLEESDGEITEEIQEVLATNDDNFKVKCENYRSIIKKFLGEIEAAKLEKARVDAFIKQRTKSVEALKDAVDQSLTVRGLTELDFGAGKRFSYIKSESVEISDESLLDSKWVKVKETRSPDKTAIKKAIKSGEEVDGATLITNRNLQIK